VCFAEFFGVGGRRAAMRVFSLTFVQAWIE